MAQEGMKTSSVETGRGDVEVLAPGQPGTNRDTLGKGAGLGMSSYQSCHRLPGQEREYHYTGTYLPRTGFIFVSDYSVRAPGSKQFRTLAVQRRAPGRAGGRGEEEEETKQERRWGRLGLGHFPQGFSLSVQKCF